MNKPDREFVLQQAARLEQESQDAVMHDIAQFAEAEIVKTYAGGVPRTPALHPLVFNMERGVCLAETVDFLTDCPDIQPYDLILANELDFGCARSGERDTTAEIAKTLGMEYVFGLEFIELADAAPMIRVETPHEVSRSALRSCCRYETEGPSASTKSRMVSSRPAKRDLSTTRVFWCIQCSSAVAPVRCPQQNARPPVRTARFLKISR